MGPAGASTRSPRPPGRAGHHPRARAGADPSRAHGGLSVRLLPRSGLCDGQRPGRRAPLRAERAAVRRCSSGQLRRLRLTRTVDGVRRERLRRDPSRAVRVGRQAAGRQLGGGRPEPPALGQGAHGGGHRRGPLLPRDDAQLRRHGQPRRVVRPPRRRRHRPPVGPGGRGRGHEEPAADGGQGRVEGPAQGQGEAHPAGGRRARVPQQSAVAGTGRGAARRPRPPGARGHDPQGDPGLPAHAHQRPSPPPGELRATGRWPARWWGWAAWAPARG